MDQKNNKFSKIKNIRTFKSDASDFVKKEGSSLSELFLTQQKQTPPTTEEENSVENSSIKTQTKKKILIFLSFFVIISIGIFVFFFLKKDGPSVQQFVPTLPTPIITSQEEISLEFNEKEFFKKQLVKIFKTTRNPGDLVSILVSKKNKDGSIHYLGSKEFLSLMEISPPTFITSFIKDDFFLGSLNLGENHPVLIFEIEKEKDTVFSGFLRWEENILNDLDFIIGDVPVSYSSLSFTDKIIKNQNVRIVEIQDSVVFLYSFLDKKYIIITNSPRALEEIIRRFVIFKFS